jgi:hypothetical protein
MYFLCKNQRKIINLSFRIYGTDLRNFIQFIFAFVCKMRQAIHGLPILPTKKNMTAFLVVVVLLLKKVRLSSAVSIRSTSVYTFAYLLTCYNTLHLTRTCCPSVGPSISFHSLKGCFYLPKHVIIFVGTYHWIV